MLPEQLVTDTIEIVAELLDADETTLTPDSALAGIEGWDSVNALRVLLHLEREHGAPIDYEHFAAAQTINDLAVLAGSGVTP
jgi:acyl carrier protein